MSQELWEKQRPAREGTNGFLNPPKPEPEAATAPAKKATKKAK